MQPGMTVSAAAQDAGCAGPVTAIKAIGTATEFGVAVVRDVDCHDGRWEIEDRDAQARKIEVGVPATTGRVLDGDRNGSPPTALPPVQRRQQQHHPGVLTRHEYPGAQVRVECGPYGRAGA
jgi:hypothetical protein